MYHYPLRVRNYVQYAAAAISAQEASTSLRLPLLVFHGEQDQTADVEGSKQLVSTAKVRAVLLQPA